MLMYKYRIRASMQIYGHDDTLAGIVHSRYPLTERDLRDHAIREAPPGYVAFGTLDWTGPMNEEEPHNEDDEKWITTVASWTSSKLLYPTH